MLGETPGNETHNRSGRDRRNHGIIEASVACQSKAAVQARALTERQFVKETPPQKRRKNQMNLSFQMHLSREKASIMKKADQEKINSETKEKKTMLSRHR